MNQVNNNPNQQQPANQPQPQAAQQPAAAPPQPAVDHAAVPAPSTQAPPVDPKAQAQEKVNQITKAGAARKEEVAKWKADETQSETAALQDMAQSDAQAQPATPAPQEAPPAKQPPAEPQSVPASNPPSQDQAPAVSQPVPEQQSTAVPVTAEPVAPPKQTAQTQPAPEKPTPAPASQPKEETTANKEPVEKKEDQPSEKPKPETEAKQEDNTPFIERYSKELEEIGVSNLSDEQKVLGAAFSQLRYELKLSKGIEPQKIKEVENALLEILHDRNAEGTIDISEEIMKQILHVLPAIESIVYELGLQLAERGVKRMGEIFVPEPVRNDSVRDQEVQEIYARRMSMLYILEQVKKRVS